jgi:hypothetical protein
MMNTHKVHESLVTDSSASKAGWSGLSQKGSDFKTGHLSQRKDSITDNPVPETGKSVVTQRSSNSSVGNIIEEFRDLDKLGQGFTSVDPLEEIDIGDGKTPRPTFVNKTLETDPRDEMIGLLKEYSDCFAWNYTEMPGLSREIVEHRLPIKSGFRPFKQRARTFRLDLLPRIKDEIHRLLEADFIRPCRYAEWVSNIVPVEKESDKLRVCIDFRNLNRATPKDQYPMPIADTLINNASRNRIISFLDGNARYNQIFMAEEDASKTTFICSGFIGLFEWVVMTFGLKNAGATYRRAMNLIFHELLGNTVEVYIDDIVVKSANFSSHIADLRKAFDKIRRYGLKMNPRKCAFGVSAGKFIGFVIHEHGIEIDPDRIKSIRNVGPPTCKVEVQKFLGKVNYLRRFISNLARKIDAFTPIFGLRMMPNSLWGQNSKKHLISSKNTYLRLPY